jgi:hypothetical protein
MTRPWAVGGGPGAGATGPATAQRRPDGALQTRLIHATVRTAAAPGGGAQRRPRRSGGLAPHPGHTDAGMRRRRPRAARWGAGAQRRRQEVLTALLRGLADGRNPARPGGPGAGAVGGGARPRRSDGLAHTWLIRMQACAGRPRRGATGRVPGVLTLLHTLADTDAGEVGGGWALERLGAAAATRRSDGLCPRLADRTQRAPGGRCGVQALRLRSFQIGCNGAALLPLPVVTMWSPGMWAT